MKDLSVTDAIVVLRKKLDDGVSLSLASLLQFVFCLNVFCNSGLDFVGDFRGLYTVGLDNGRL